MAKSVNSTNAGDGQAMRLGTWHDDENKLFLEGLAKFGKDFKQLEKYIGTRTHAQVRTHYLQYAKKNGIASPEPTRKRKTDETPDGTETKKKLKSTPAASKAKETPKSSIAATPTKATPKLSARKEIPSKVSSPNKKMSPGKDIIPPSGKSTTKAARTSPKKSVAPKRLNPVVNESVAAVIEDDDIISNDVSKFVIFVQRDEVQTVIAGIVGFVLVYAIKKYIG
jgi:Myb-like DNA-binding domain